MSICSTGEGICLTSFGIRQSYKRFKVVLFIGFYAFWDNWFLSFFEKGDFALK